MKVQGEFGSAIYSVQGLREHLLTAQAFLQESIAHMLKMLVSDVHQVGILASLYFFVATMFSLGCPEGDIRLLEGSTALEGRVEVCINSAWSRVCEAGYDNADAKVVCTQLGYSSVGECS